MPLYLSKFNYTPETWARMSAKPEDRRKAAEAYIESVGGKLHGFWYAFGAHDGFTLWEAPDSTERLAPSEPQSSKTTRPAERRTPQTPAGRQPALP